MRPLLLLCVVSLACSLEAAAADFPRFHTQEIDPHAGDICYAVTVADINSDGKLDMIVVTEDAVLWYENPRWQKHDIVRKATSRDNVCIQPHDIDGDGRVDFALGAGWPSRDSRKPGTLQWLGRDVQGRWQVHPISFGEPNLHRLRWGDVKGTGRKQLVVAPLQGRGTKGPNWGEGEGVHVLVYDTPQKGGGDDWSVEVADSSMHTVHNLQLIDLDGDRRDEVVLAAWEGVFVLDRDPAGRWSKTRIGTGNQDSKPFKGSSEVKVGRLRQNSPYVATIEPWHGHQVVVYVPASAAHDPAATRSAQELWSRHVIAEPLQWGHAVWCADLDGDGDDELIIGQRDPNKPGSKAPRGPGVFVFDPKPGASPLAFDRYTIDDGGMACEDALTADLDGDGRDDIVACGRATHNVRIYWNRRSSQTDLPPAKADPKINAPFQKPDVKAYIKRFESADRETYARRHAIVAALGLVPGMSVADVGAGTGLFTRLLAEQVGPTGKVFAVDIAPRFLAHITAESRKRGQTQVRTVLGDQDTTNLASDSVDLVFMCDVYHHLEKPARTLASIHAALRAGGKLVVVEFDRVEGRSTSFVLQHVRANQDVFRKEIESAGFRQIPSPQAPKLKENFLCCFVKLPPETKSRD
jgi:ubiquinone/menaquinone biosynthesis C-methylase UbiE